MQIKYCIFHDDCPAFFFVENQSLSWHERDLQKRPSGTEPESHAENVHKRV